MEANSSPHLKKIKVRQDTLFKQKNPFSCGLIALFDKFGRMATDNHQNFRVLQMIAGALFGSLFIYGGVLVLISQKWDPAEAKSLHSIEFLLAVFMAVSVAATIPILKKIFLGKIQASSEPGEKFRAFQMTHIVALALAESVMIFGFAAALLLKNRAAIFPFWGFAILLFVLHAPRRAAFDDLFR